jgi:hypothetical protein
VDCVCSCSTKRIAFGWGYHSFTTFQSSKFPSPSVRTIRQANSAALLATRYSVPSPTTSTSFDTSLNASVTASVTSARISRPPIMSTTSFSDPSTWARAYDAIAHPSIAPPSRSSVYHLSPSSRFFLPGKCNRTAFSVASRTTIFFSSPLHLLSPEWAVQSPAMATSMSLRICTWCTPRC